MTPCPHCDGPGRSVSARTVRSHTQPAAAPIADDGWYICRSPACDVGYFGPDREPILASALTATPFFRSDAPERTVCFCFGHTAAALRDDLLRHGNSTLRANIAAACKQGLDDCERNNPEGRCCLGNVGEVLRAAKPSLQAAPHCCAESEAS